MCLQEYTGADADANVHADADTRQTDINLNDGTWRVGAVIIMAQRVWTN